MTRNQVVALLALLTFSLGAVFGVIGYGYSYRPIIDYCLGCSYEVEDSIDFTYKALEVELKVRNRGNTDACLMLILTLQNATFTDKENASSLVYSDENDEVKVYWRALKNEEVYGGKTFHIIPKSNLESFTVNYKIETRTAGNIATDFINKFIELIPYAPVTLTFEKTDTNIYKRTV